MQQHDFDLKVTQFHVLYVICFKQNTVWSQFPYLIKSDFCAFIKTKTNMS